MLFNGRTLIFTFSRTQVRIAEHERLQSILILRCLWLVVRQFMEHDWEIWLSIVFRLTCSGRIQDWRDGLHSLLPRTKDRRWGRGCMNEVIAVNRRPFSHNMDRDCTHRSHWMTRSILLLYNSHSSLLRVGDNVVLLCQCSWFRAT